MLQYSLEQTHQCRLLDTAYLISTQVKTSCILNENEYYEVLTGSCKTTKDSSICYVPGLPENLMKFWTPSYQKKMYLNTYST